MKLMSRNFSTKEKILIGVLAVMLLGLLYYRLVYANVSAAISSANSEAAELQSELDIAQLKVAKINKMESDMDELRVGAKMGSYNNSKPETIFLHNVLSGTPDYSVSFDEITRDGDQIRRNFTLQYKAASYTDAQNIMKKLTSGEYRCLIGDVQCSQGVRSSMFDYRNNYYYADYMTVSATATFFETMVGGVEDAGLPPAK